MTGKAFCIAGVLAVSMFLLIIALAQSMFQNCDGHGNFTEVHHPPAPSDFKRPFFRYFGLLAEFGQEGRVKCADFNRDGLMDFVVSWATSPFSYSSITIFYNDGNCSFSKKTVYTIDTYIKDIDAADYDGDGDVDIIFTYDETMGYYYTNGTVNLLRNLGGDIFDNPEQIIWLGPGKPGSMDNWINLHVTSADFDRDGDVDLLIGGNCGKVALYKNDGYGNFTLASIVYDYGICSWGLASADFNNDGWIDYVVAANGSLYLKLNNRSGFDHSPGIKIGNLREVRPDALVGMLPPSASLAPIDYNNDDRMDLLLGIDCIMYLCMNFNLSFKPFYVCWLPPIEYTKRGRATIDSLWKGSNIASADFDGDGYTDVVMCSSSAKVRLFLNNRTYVALTGPHHPPDVGIYLMGKLLTYLPRCMFKCAIVIGNITFKAEGLEPLSRVEFYLDGKLVENDTSPPYEWEWRERCLIPKKHVVEAVAYRLNGECGGRYRIEVWKIL